MPVYSRIKKGTYFPDIVVACGDVSYENCKVYQNDWDSNGFKVITKQALTNPILIAEVWSEGNSEIEKKTKFEHYKAIESLQEYVTIENKSYTISIYFRVNGIWQDAEPITGRDNILEIPYLSLSLAFEESYKKCDGIAEVASCIQVQ